MALELMAAAMGLGEIQEMVLAARTALALGEVQEKVRAARTALALVSETAMALDEALGMAWARVLESTVFEKEQNLALGLL